MAHIYLRHPKHGEKVAISWIEARDDMEHGWEEFDPSDPDDSALSVPAEMPASGVADNALKPRRKRKE